MAQLNPNFEIDFNDINSYEQIQLINDTQLAKENLLMHKAYREPAEDEIIRNQFSSFTFVDFCPKLMTTSPAGTTTATGGGGSAARRTPTPTLAGQNGRSGVTTSRPGSAMLRANQYELETFSDLFDRINAWLKLNKDWRVVSMETLVFDCTSQFNHLKSSIHSSYLPRNMRGLRLYLSPSKSRFSGPQKIGCINVIPRKTRGSYHIEEQQVGDSNNTRDPLEYETLDEILARLNELLLTRPIEGRILSVETITLPIVNGYVNTETNYLMDNRLNLLSQRVFSHASASPPASTPPPPSQPGAVGSTPAAGPGQEQCTQTGAGRPVSGQTTNGLIDILRVYYEFGPMVCGLVNLIDFLPRFQLHQPGTSASGGGGGGGPAAHLDPDQRSPRDPTPTGPARSGSIEVDSTESLTRLINRSLGWFEAERKRFLQGEGACDSSSCSSSSASTCDQLGPLRAAGSSQQEETIGRPRQHVVDLKVCNLQIHTKVMLKSQLAQVTPETALECIQTGQMFHAPPREPIVCYLCAPPGPTPTPTPDSGPISSATHELHEWCSHLLDLNQAYELKFVRLAYVVPVNSARCAAASARRLASSLRSLPSLRALSSGEQLAKSGEITTSGREGGSCAAVGQIRQEPSDSRADTTRSSGSATSSSSSATSDSSSSHSSNSSRSRDVSCSRDENDHHLRRDGALTNELQEVDEILAKHVNEEELAKRASLDVVHETNRRHRESEQAHQVDEEEATGERQQQHGTGKLIGQLTYRLFAPCQLVNSSSCFSINPVNSSNPLARRGSVDLNGNAAGGGGASLSSENATPSTLLLPPAGSGGSAGGSLSESTLSLSNQPAGSGGGHTTAAQYKQQIISFGAFFPALSHDIITSTASGGGHHHHHHPSGGNNPTSSSYRFNTNEFESVEAIRRRMEVYVTTNSMKVLAAETLIVNLSDHLSCLSSAIEQTIVKASFVPTRPPSSWVSVYVLYAAVDEPHLPSQLLEQQRLRERLGLISEAGEETSSKLTGGGGGSASQMFAGENCKNQGQENMVPVFDDDFKCDPENASSAPQPKVAAADWTTSTQQVLASEQQVANTMASLNLEDGSIRVELSRAISPPGSASELPLYNSAYDRTVALPTQPDSMIANYLEPVDFNLNGWPYGLQSQHAGGGNDSTAAAASNTSLWLDEHDLIDVQSYQLSDSNVRDASKLLRMRKMQQQLQVATESGEPAGGGKRKKKKKNGRGDKRAISKKGRRDRRGRSGREDSQCSIM